MSVLDLQSAEGVGYFFPVTWDCIDFLFDISLHDSQGLPGFALFSPGLGVGVHGWVPVVASSKFKANCFRFNTRSPM